MTRRPLVLVGAGDLGRDALSVVEPLESAGVVSMHGFVDDRPELGGTERLGREVVGDLEWLIEHRGEYGVLVTIGSPAGRRRVVKRLAEFDNVLFATVVHPTVVATSTVSFGDGSLVMAGSTFTVNVSVGDHVVINPGCTVAHDVRLEDYVYLSPGVDLAGRVVVEPGAYLGTGAVVLPGRRVGADAVVGAGAVVVQDVPSGTTVAGVPARNLERR